MVKRNKQAKTNKTQSKKKKSSSVAPRPPAPVAGLRKKRDESFTDIYSNFAQCGMTTHDISVSFFNVDNNLGMPDIDKPELIEAAKVTMSPLQSGEVGRLLIRSYARWCAEYGGDDSRDQFRIIQELIANLSPEDNKSDNS